MKCPQCQRRIISFWRWGVSQNSSTYRCPHCNIDLCGGPAVARLILALLLLFPISIGIALLVRNDRPLAWPSPYLILLVSYLPAWLVVAFAVWKFGAYRIAPPELDLTGESYFESIDEQADGEVVELSAATLEPFVASHPRVVIHLWAPWNGYDGILLARLPVFAGANPHVAFATLNYDVPENRTVAERLVGVEIHSSPLLLWFENGRPVKVRHEVSAADFGFRKSCARSTIRSS